MYVVIEEESFSNRNYHCIIHRWYRWTLNRIIIIHYYYYSFIGEARIKLVLASFY